MKIASLCGLFLLQGCALFGGGKSEEQWQEREVQNVSWDDLWQLSKQALVQGRFTVVDVDEVEGRIQSAWQYGLSPYSREEKRERATFVIQRQASDRYLVRVRVESEKNKDMTKTMNPEGAKWVPGSDNPDLARFLLQYVLSRTQQFGPSKEFYQRQPWKEKVPGGGG